MVLKPIGDGRFPFMVESYSMKLRPLMTASPATVFIPVSVNSDYF